LQRKEKKIHRPVYTRKKLFAARLRRTRGNSKTGGTERGTFYFWAKGKLNIGTKFFLSALPDRKKRGSGAQPITIRGRLNGPIEDAGGGGGGGNATFASGRERTQKGKKKKKKPISGGAFHFLVSRGQIFPLRGGILVERGYNGPGLGNNSLAIDTPGTASRDGCSGKGEKKKTKKKKKKKWVCWGGGGRAGQGGGFFSGPNGGVGRGPLGALELRGAWGAAQTWPAEGGNGSFLPLIGTDGFCDMEL